MLVELKALFSKTLYHWVAAFDFNISGFYLFSAIFSSFN